MAEARGKEEVRAEAKAAMVGVAVVAAASLLLAPLPVIGESAR